MDELLKQAFGQAPSLVVLVIVVKLFLISQKEGTMFIRQLHDEHIQARAEMKTAIKDNTDAMRELAEAVTSIPIKK